MDKLIIKKEYFFLTGSAESAPLFYYPGSVGVIRTTGALLIIINNNGISKWFIEKQASEKLMRYWVGQSSETVASEFTLWKTKWQKKETRLFDLAQKPIRDWRKLWVELDELSLEFWEESYFLDTLDPFADELEGQITRELARVKVDNKNIYELIATVEPTRTQKATLDFDNLSRGKITREGYCKRYWYYKGSWVGGDVLTESVLTNDFLPKPVEIDYLKRKKDQEIILQKLDTKIQTLIHLLQIFTLWREERKAFMQMLSVCYSVMAREIEKKESVFYKDVVWSRPDEIEQLKNNNSFILERKKLSVFVCSPKNNPPEILTGENAKIVIGKLVSEKKFSSIRGMVACKGIVKGRARIVLKEHQFGKFEKGEILITANTRPEFLPIMSLAAAIVTDEGGLTSHAAIVSRELKKPCVVGTKIATQVFEDGDMVEVDANNGIIKKL